MPTQLNTSVNSIWSLFLTGEPQVVLCETEHEALNLKTRWEASVDVYGPFEHPRHELPLIEAAAEAALRLGQLASALDSTEHAAEVWAIQRTLNQAIGSIYPFDSVTLSDGSSWNLKSEV